MDAARLLPVLGAFLFCLPMLWRPEAAGHSTADEGVYLFLVWALLIGVARLFAPGLVASSIPAEGGAPLPGPVTLSPQPGAGPSDDETEGG